MKADTVSSMVDDVGIGKNLARLRGNTTQAELAAAMKSRGWKWVQSTVAAVEKGERPLRLREAHDLERILHTAVNELLVANDDRARLGELERLGEFAELEWARVRDALVNMMEARQEVLRAADDVRARTETSPELHALADRLENDLAVSDYYSVVRAAVLKVLDDPHYRPSGPWPPSEDHGVELTTHLVGIERTDDWSEPNLKRERLEEDFSDEVGQGSDHG